ncbi:hypothetical protein BDV95DRAFT_603569 [Massariosphaeria phaeospora]|uniref:F-box domain-containing protein n=1 Tax=Massariosphaeria phaeospora TaxID=100035 RepID=A0A7C8MCH6_9PLEO|nr:hypothetical protein BDV95DRAFT_603569 [Massariosphaeria phaeospora]
MASVELSALPNDIIIAIATQLRRQHSSNVDFLAFILVNKQWHQLGLRVFYGNIALTDSTLAPFTESFNVLAYGKCVRSLTLKIEATDDETPRQCAAKAEPTLLSKGLTQLTPLISNFKNLASFSLCAQGLSRNPVLADRQPESVPRKNIVALLKALPETCTNLELDTRGYDHREEYEQVHMCDAVRAILPRMHNVRIRVGAMCHEMFGTGEFTPTHLPNLKSLIVNYGA